MFTGIIEGLGTIAGMKPSGQGKRLSINADYFLDNTKTGDSIAVNGACLTVVMINGKRFEVDVSPETISKTTFGLAKVGDRVNLERSLRLSDRIDGHLVSGHIDAMGIIKQKQPSSNSTVITIALPESMSRYIIKKGSVAVDGISLTINNCDRNGFDVSIIPHTGKLTSLGFKKTGDPVNIETDMIGKYVECFITNKFVNKKETATGQSSIDIQLLAKTGFLKAG